MQSKHLLITCKWYAKKTAQTCPSAASPCIVALFFFQNGSVSKSGIRKVNYTISTEYILHKTPIIKARFTLSVFSSGQTSDYNLIRISLVSQPRVERTSREFLKFRIN